MKKKPGDAVTKLMHKLFISEAKAITSRLSGSMTVDVLLIEKDIRTLLNRESRLAHKHGYEQAVDCNLSKERIDAHDKCEARSWKSYKKSKEAHQ